MSDAAASTVSIGSMEEATELLKTTTADWETCSTLALVQIILQWIPYVNGITAGVQWILALVQVITIGPVSENLAALATFYNDESNWKNPAAYKVNQDVKMTAYKAYDADMASDPAAIEEFEQGGGIASYILPFQV